MKRLNRTSITIASVVLLAPAWALLAALSKDRVAIQARGVCCGGDFAVIGGLERDDGPVLSGGGFTLTGGLWIDEMAATPATLTGVVLAGAGTLTGDLAALSADDGVVLHAMPDPAAAMTGSAANEIIVRAVTSVASPMTIEVAIDSRINEPSGSVEILLKNWKTETFEPVGRDIAGVAERTTTIEDITAMGYINDAGEIELLVRHRVDVSFFGAALESSIDRITIGIHRANR